MQQRDTTPTPGPAQPGQGAARAGRKPTSRRDALLGCGCLTVIAVGAVVIAVAVFKSGNGQTTATQPSTSASASPTAAGAQAAGAQASAAAGTTLTGFGATFDTWNATRHPDGDFDPNTVYDSDPTLPQLNGHAGARYTTVQGSNGYVVSYQINFHPHTTINAALTDVLRNEFPPDATYLWKRTVPGQCYQAEVKSPKLAEALTGEQLGDGTGLVFLEAKTLPPGGAEGFDPKDVTYANLGFLSIAGADQAPSC